MAVSPLVLGGLAASGLYWLHKASPQGLDGLIRKRLFGPDPADKGTSGSIPRPGDDPSDDPAVVEVQEFDGLGLDPLAFVTSAAPVTQSVAPLSLDWRDAKPQKSPRSGSKPTGTAKESKSDERERCGRTIGRLCRERPWFCAGNAAALAAAGASTVLSGGIAAPTLAGPVAAVMIALDRLECLDGEED